MSPESEQPPEEPTADETTGATSPAEGEQEPEEFEGPSFEDEEFDEEREEEIEDAEAEAEEAQAQAPAPRRRRRRRTAESESESPARRRRRAAEPEPEPEPPAAPAPRRRRGRRDPSLPPPVVRAQARYVRSSARKARLVCDHIRGKSVEEARAILALTPRAIARDWSKLLESAVANAEQNHELVGEDLYIKAVHADEGPTIKRFRPRAMGRATRIRKRTSHLTILLTPKE
jgi:ribosomal protein L22